MEIDIKTTVKLPIGIENFEKIRTAGFYYVDKTGMIKELLNNWGEVNLFTRPRRFGKSLNMSMLKYFFEYGTDKALFDGLEIAGEQRLCDEYMGRFPVISISLKDVNGRNFDDACAGMSSVIGWEALRFRFLLESDRLDSREKEIYEQLVTIGKAGQPGFVMSYDVLTNSLYNLSVLLHKHYDQKVIILIDEYDVPLDKAQQFGYYDEMVAVIRNMFSKTLKSNASLQFAVLTGCLRVSKESIFTGLNNPQIFSIADVRYDEHFGFVDDEVKELLSYYNLSDKYEVVKEWYDGYHFGDVDVYCPWDVINYCSLLRTDPDAQPQNYWSNTSSNDIVRNLIRRADKPSAMREIEQLIAGESIEKEIRQELTYRELYDSIDNLWSILFTTGYLTQAGKPDGDVFRLRIPNREIRKIFTTQIYKWFQESAEKDGETLNAFCEALKNGDASEVERRFHEYLKKTISIRDTSVRKSKKENFYHGILLGLCAYKDSWAVSSNRESGDGYSDILIEDVDSDIGIVIEVKYPDDENLEAGCAGALEQIEKRNYEEVLRDDGMTTILKYGIACYKKRCKVVLADAEK